MGEEYKMLAITDTEFIVVSDYDDDNHNGGDGEEDDKNDNDDDDDDDNNCYDYHTDATNCDADNRNDN